jgi:glycerol-1-phosphate dehydrogenase [NAD(P)+]
MMQSTGTQPAKAPIVYIGRDALPRLVEFCEGQRFEQCTLVADHTTYGVIGRRIAEAWTDRRWGVHVTLLNGGPVTADEYQIMQVLLRADQSERVYLAVGSGTITDIVRFVGSVTRRRFISVPTAPSVDAYTSATAALEIGKWKQTVPALPPIAVFADLDTLCSAPRSMIAAGFGDVLGKYTSLADWKLGHLLWGEAYSETIAQRARSALTNCRRKIAEGDHDSSDGIRTLFESLIESGQCIADFGSSESASGSEHHLSHYWEMSRLREHRPVLLHGAQVAVGAVMIARIYERIRSLARAQVVARLSSVTLPDRQQEAAAIRDGYGATAEGIIAAHSAFLDMTARDLDALKERIVDHWDEIQEIASTVPPAHELAGALRRVSAPVTLHELGLEGRDLSNALKYASYLRNRFTVLKLARLLRLSLKGPRRS